MKLLRYSFVLALIAALTACNMPGASTPPAATAAPTVDTPTATPAAASLTADVLRNATYEVPFYAQTVTLFRGHYEIADGTTTLRVDLIDPIALGDVNADGVDDAVVLLAENGGGSGVFVSIVVMLNQNGQPVQSGSMLIDDRPAITNLSVQNGLIIVDATVHGVSDPACCPTLVATETYQLVDGTLTLLSFASKTPDGSVRLITIDSPVAGTEVSGSVQVTGSVTISPFENNLGYRITDQAGNQLAEGPVQVTSAEMGGPGTFDVTIDLSAIPAGTVIQLALVDLSAADGSILAMASVELTVR
jgi:hypothetical protein